MKDENTLPEFQRLIEIMHRLRRECPWDREQSLKSLRKYVLEEAYEVVEAINDIDVDGPESLVEELGDLLLQVLFQSEILDELTKSNSSLMRIIKELNEKLTRRHPHVFGQEEASDSDQVIRNWEAIKEKEKPQSYSSLLGKIEKSLTSLQRADKIGRRSKKINFDWSKSEDLFSKFEEEIQELKESRSQSEKEDELGDLLFCLCQWARKEGIDPELALSSTNQKFIKRMKVIERNVEERNLDFKNLPEEEKEKMWQEAKLEIRHKEKLSKET